MLFSKLLNGLSKLSLPADQLVIIGSGPLGVRNIRSSNDLDILVTKKLWTILSQKYPVATEFGVDKIKVTKDIEIVGKGSSFYDSNIASIEQIFSTADTINGHLYINLDLLKKFKKKMNRPKDLVDIKLIDEFNSSAKS